METNATLGLPFHEERQRGAVAVEEALFAHRTDLAVAEKAGQAKRTKLLLHHLRVVARSLEEALAAAVAAAETAAKDRRACEFVLGPRQQFGHFQTGRGGIASLPKLGLLKYLSTDFLR